MGPVAAKEGPLEQCIGLQRVVRGEDLVGPGLVCMLLLQPGRHNRGNGHRQQSRASEDRDAMLIAV